MVPLGRDRDWLSCTKAPSYAPPGRHLVSTVFLGDGPAAMADGALVDLARRDLARITGGDGSWWQPVAISRVPHAQFRQAPGLYGRLPQIPRMLALHDAQFAFEAASLEFGVHANGAIDD